MAIAAAAVLVAERLPALALVYAAGVGVWAGVLRKALPTHVVRVLAAAATLGPLVLVGPRGGIDVAELTWAFVAITVVALVDVRPIGARAMAVLASGLVLALATTGPALSNPAPWFVAWVVAAVVALFGALGAARITGRSWLEVAATALVIVVATPILAAVRPPPPASSAAAGGASAARGGDELGGAATADLSRPLTQLDTSLRSTPGDGVVLRVRADGPHFLRGQVFDTWDGRRWTSTGRRTEPAVALTLPPGRGSSATATRFTSTITVVGSSSAIVYAAPEPARTNLGRVRAVLAPNGELRADPPLRRGETYWVESVRAPVTADVLRAHDPRSTDGYQADPADLQLPAVPARVLQLARTVAAGAPTTYDTVVAFERWIAAHTRYTLDIPTLPAGADTVEQFLFVDRRGFCEQIASSLAVLLRAVHVPARVATGYVAVERRRLSDDFVVRAKHAHAWVEVYFPGVGWQPFDPTAAVPLAGDMARQSAAERAVDAVRSVLPVLVGAVLAAGVVALVAVAFGTWRRRRARSWEQRAVARLRAVARAVGVDEPTATINDLALACAPRLGEQAPSIGRDLTAAVYGPVPLEPPRRVEIDACLGQARFRRRRRRPGEPAAGPRSSDAARRSPGSQR